MLIPEGAILIGKGYKKVGKIYARAVIVILGLGRPSAGQESKFKSYHLETLKMKTNIENKGKNAIMFWLLLTFDARYETILTCLTSKLLSSFRRFRGILGRGELLSKIILLPPKRFFS